MRKKRRFDRSIGTFIHKTNNDRRGADEHQRSAARTLGGQSRGLRRAAARGGGMTAPVPPESLARLLRGLKLPTIARHADEVAQFAGSRSTTAP